MGDPVMNCVLAVCCPPQSENQQHALAGLLERDGVVGPESSANVAKWLLSKFDLAPQGTLQPFKDAIAQLARGADYKAE